MQLYHLQLFILTNCQCVIHLTTPYSLTTPSIFFPSHLSPSCWIDTRGRRRRVIAPGGWHPCWLCKPAAIPRRLPMMFQTCMSVDGSAAGPYQKSLSTLKPAILAIWQCNVCTYPSISKTGLWSAWRIGQRRQVSGVLKEFSTAAFSSLKRSFSHVWHQCRHRASSTRHLVSAATNGNVFRVSASQLSCVQAFRH